MQSQTGRLTLVPTPIDETTPLEPVALERLQTFFSSSRPDPTIMIVEELKEARRRWIRWGLPRAAMDAFEVLNEQSPPKSIDRWIQQAQKGTQLFLMSDCGLPAFCDPGRDLVDACHRLQIPVTATPFPNSVLLALILSGFPSDSFFFAGFPERKTDARHAWFKKTLAHRTTVVTLDAPYRLHSALEAIASIQPQRPLFLAQNLNQPSETCHRATALQLFETLKKTHENKKKSEFIIVVGPL